MENPRIRNAAKEVYIARERLEIGNMLGKGDYTAVTWNFEKHKLCEMIPLCCI